MWFITHKVDTQNTHLTSKTPSSLYSYPCLSLLSFLAKSVHWWLCFVLIFEETWQKFAFNWRKKPSTCQNLHFRYRIGNSGECLWAPALLNTVSETASAIKNMFHSNESWLNYKRWLKIALYILNVNINYCRFLFFFFTWEYKITSIKLL